jgi:citrate synthase
MARRSHDAPLDTQAGVSPMTTLSSEEAAAYLGVKLETLYAYVSRGLVKGLPGARGKGRRYRHEDLERVRARSAGPAAAALRYGEPVLETRITRITPQGPEYRGRLATALVHDRISFEAVAEMLWTEVLPEVAPRWPGDGPALHERDLARLLPRGSSPLAALALVLPVLAAADPLRYDAEPAAVMARARRLIPRLAASCALALEPKRLPAALATSDPVRALAIALGAPTSAKALDLLRAAFILCADHELNTSTFAARVAASTGADLHACLGAALAAFGGPRHGGASEQVELMAREAASPSRAAAVVGERLRRGERLPGFGHPLYPDGDPRVAPLLERALVLKPGAPRLRTLLAVAEAVEATGRPRANLDVAIAAACAALDLPLGLGPAIFAIGRSAGWVANILEQQTSSSALRPRARFVGDGAAGT